MAYKLTVANYDRQANFEHDLLLCCCSSIHSITHSSKSQYASYGGRLHFPSCKLHSRSHSLSGVQAKFVDCACDLKMHTCYTISRLRLCCTILRSHAQSQDSENTQRKLKIMQTQDCANSQIAWNIYTSYIYSIHLQ